MSKKKFVDKVAQEEQFYRDMFGAEMIMSSEPTKTLSLNDYDEALSDWEIILEDSIERNDAEEVASVRRHMQQLRKQKRAVIEMMKKNKMMNKEEAVA